MVLSHMWAKFHRMNLKTHRGQYKCFRTFFGPPCFTAPANSVEKIRKYQIKYNFPSLSAFVSIPENQIAVKNLTQ